MAKKIPFFTTLPVETVREIGRRAKEQRVKKWKVVALAFAPTASAFIKLSSGGPRRKIRWKRTVKTFKQGKDLWAKFEPVEDGGPRRKARGKK